MNIKSEDIASLYAQYETAMNALQATRRAKSEHGVVDDRFFEYMRTERLEHSRVLNLRLAIQAAESPKRQRR